MLVFNPDAAIHEYIKHYGEVMASALENVVPSNWNMPSVLRESMAYSLMAGGKRMRPVLTIAACEAFGGSADDAIPAACAVELIHTYSLIHDDLPAMDNDDFRRGKPTNHKVYGEAMAILAGDALLTHAFYILASMPSVRPNVTPQIALAIAGELAFYAGASGMVGGQAADILGQQGSTTLPELEYIHTHKTSDLIIFSLRAGGRIAGADDAQLSALTTFGNCIGLSFQIQDDVLDVIGDAGKLGKSTNSDSERNKVTYPYLIGLEESRRKVVELTECGKSALTSGAIPEPRRLLQLADYLMSRQS